MKRRISSRWFLIGYALGLLVMELTMDIPYWMAIGGATVWGLITGYEES